MACTWVCRLVARTVAQLGSEDCIAVRGKCGKARRQVREQRACGRHFYFNDSDSAATWIAAGKPNEEASSWCP